MIMNQTTEGGCKGTGGGCSLLAGRKCCQRVHEILAALLGSGAGTPYIGSLFSGDYPGFETQEKCRQYVREYLPFHLPQVEAGLLQAMAAMPRGLPMDRPIRVLDVGAGPGTVALALERLTCAGKVKGHFVVDAVEPSRDFCQMLRLAKAYLAGDSVEIRNIYRGDILDLLPALAGQSPEYDWIVAANVLSPLSEAWERRVGQQDVAKRKGPDPMANLECLARREPKPRDAWSAQDLGFVFWYALTQGTRDGQGFLTLIENQCRKYIQDPSDFLRQLQECEALTKVAGSPCAAAIGRIDRCGFYRTKMGNDMPRLIMLTMKAAA